MPWEHRSSGARSLRKAWTWPQAKTAESLRRRRLRSRSTATRASGTVATRGEDWLPITAALFRRFSLGFGLGCSDPEVFEWYLDYSVYRHIMTAEVQLEASVCISGCGNSGTAAFLIDARLGCEDRFAVRVETDMPVDMLEDGEAERTVVQKNARPRWLIAKHAGASRLSEHHCCGRVPRRD